MTAARNPKLIGILLFLLITFLHADAQSILIAYGNSWKYLDNGSNQGTAWRSSSFNDASWLTARSRFGYGDPVATCIKPGVSCGSNYCSPNPSTCTKYITYYFRKSFTIANKSLFSSFTIKMFRDDGVAVYINGVRIVSNNLVAGAAYNTFATAAAADDGQIEQTFANIPTTNFVNGTNVLAVEVHQNSTTSSDLTFDLQLAGIIPSSVSLTRGPYLQMGSQTALTFRWRTNYASNSRVQIGTVYGSYPIVVNDTNKTTEHAVRIKGLTSNTKYYYRIGTSTQVLQGSTSNFFTTVPAANTTRKVRIAAFGDCGRNDNSFQTQTLTQYRNYLTANGIDAADAMILLGDNAYNSGTDAEYTTNFFTPYGSSILKNHKLYPAPGNHDYYSTSQTSRTGAYYKNFSMPKAGECGGVASGTEAYYSFDIGNIHFLSLDSYGQESPNNTRLYDTLGPQVTWVKKDLNANTKKWVVVYWHHPPYTMGSHNSDTETELINIRNNFIRILERYGVDLIICGHSHDYERSYLLKGHYGNEATFNLATHAVSNSSGKYDGSGNSCPYITASGAANHGTVYVVAGSSGADGGVNTGYPHNAMPFSFDDGGMLYFEVDDNRLDAKFIRRDGIVADKFTIMQNVNNTSTYSITAGTSITLKASWPGSYIWNTGASTRSITITPPAGTTVYTVKDFTTGTCLTDHITVTAFPNISPVTLTKNRAQLNNNKK
ncbi:metallophosphoesterase family protein [Chitinophagaceae bacterium LB-8]|uniref:Metallophosphoesterase family protein n=1 Tax=Paraflavisolibacter caeni TaxID=2982496 RepID=A0A9X3BI36_9BACT|nr:metallophosphoesterase family protein [Paraflavisolibacter caeni]MCU7549638.1 metallophosphoesterase family protein [Paraflavisolibacter caeni]